MADYKFPTETIELPSTGKCYPEGSPLRNGTIDIKYMTAKEEDILTSTNLLQKGIAIDKLMESLIVTPGVHPDDLLTGDLNAVMIASRILAYGKDYNADVICERCGSTFTHNIDLSKLEMVTPEQMLSEYTVTLPTNTVVTFKLLTRHDEKVIKNDINALKKIDPDLENNSPTRLAHTITSVNGNRDKKIIREFAENMLIRDVRAFREEYRKVSPDVDTSVSVSCKCGHTFTMRMPFGANFFWPEL